MRTTLVYLSVSLSIALLYQGAIRNFDRRVFISTPRSIPASSSSTVICRTITSIGYGRNTPVCSSGIINPLSRCYRSTIVSTTAWPVSLFFFSLLLLSLLLLSLLLLSLLLLAVHSKEVALVLDRRFFSGQCLCRGQQCLAKQMTNIAERRTKESRVVCP